MSDLVERLARTVYGLHSELEVMAEHDGGGVPATCPMCQKQITVAAPNLVSDAHIESLLDEVRRERILNGEPAISFEGSWDEVQG